MGEQHLDPLPLPSRGRVGVGEAEVPGHVAGAFVDRPQDLVSRLFWGALRPACAGVAVGLAGAVPHEAVGIDAFRLTSKGRRYRYSSFPAGQV